MEEKEVQELVEDGKVENVVEAKEVVEEKVEDEETKELEEE